VFAVASGSRRGFWLSLAQYVGLLVGVILGAAVAPPILDRLQINAPDSKSLGAVLILIVGGVLGSTVGWRTIFYGIAVLSALIAIASAISLSPAQERAREPVRTSFGARLTVLTLATTMLWASGSFTFFTYIAVVLRHTAAVGTAGLAGFLLLFGLSGIGGAAAAGWLTDTKGPLVPLAAALGLVAVALTGLGITAVVAGGGGAGAVVASALALAAYGTGSWAITPPQQHRLLEAGGDDRLLLSLNASAIYAGVAAGSALGGITLAATSSTAAVCLLAAGIELLALASLAVAYPRPREHV